MLAFNRWYSIFIYKSLEIHGSLKAYWIQILFNTTSKFHAKKINESILHAKMLHNFTYLFDNTLNFKFINTNILRGIYFLNDVDRYDNIIQLSKGRFTRYNFCLRLSHAIFIARAARVMEKSYTISTI